MRKSAKKFSDSRKKALYLLFEEILGGVKAENLSRVIVDPFFEAGNLRDGNALEARSFWIVPTHHFILILVRAALV